MDSLERCEMKEQMWFESSEQMGCEDRSYPFVFLQNLY